MRNLIKMIDSALKHFGHTKKPFMNVNGIGNNLNIRSTHTNFCCELYIDGNDNNVEIGSNCMGKLKIQISGDNHRVSIGDNCSFFNHTGIDIRSYSCTYMLGGGAVSQGGGFYILEPNTSIVIGKDCTFGSSSMFLTSDFHSIIDLHSGLRINPAENITIGDHVWIGFGVKILKGVTIGNNSIIGINSIVCKNIPNNCIAAGSPSKVIRSDITWDINLL